MSRINTHAALYGAACVALLALAGCSRPATEVTGKVTYQGKPLPTGSVTLVASNGTVYSGDIRPDGTYQIPQVPAGAVKIAVVGGRGNVNKPPPGGRGEGGDPPRGQPAVTPAAGPELPDRYANPETSQLTGTVELGKSLDITIP